MCSTPAATTRPRCPAWIADAPLKAACSDEPHWRSTVEAQTVSGHPATSDRLPSDVQRCVLSHAAHLHVFELARLEIEAVDEPFMTCAASSSARISESEPFRLPIGERTASTMYASLAIDNSIELPGPRNVRQLSLSASPNPTPAPATRSRTVLVTRISPASASAATRATSPVRAYRISGVSTRKSPIYTPAMATTAVERKLLVGGEWVETGEWIEVRSPYDGELVGRVPGGSPQARDALDAAEQAMREPLPAHERAAILDRVAALLSERADEAARTISAEAGKPMKAARVEAARAVSTFTMAAVEARKLAGDVVPMDASPAGEGKLALTLRQPIGIVGAISRSTSLSTSSRTRSRQRSPQAAPWSSSPQRRPRCRRSFSPSSKRRPGCLQAG